MAEPALGAPSSADKTIAKAGVLTLRDLPPGWASKPRTLSGGTVSALVSTIPTCRQFKPAFGNVKAVARAQPPYSYAGRSLILDNSVLVYPDVAHAVSQLNGAAGLVFSACFKQFSAGRLLAEEARAEPGSDLPDLAVAARPANAGVSVGDAEAGVAVTLTAMTDEGLSLNFYAMEIVIRVGRAIDSFSYEKDTTPITDAMPEAIEASVARLRTALAFKRR